MEMVHDARRPEPTADPSGPRILNDWQSTWVYQAGGRRVCVPGAGGSATRSPSTRFAGQPEGAAIQCDLRLGPRDLGLERPDVFLAQSYLQQRVVETIPT